MKIEVNRKSLGEALSVLSSVVPTRTTKPILQSVLCTPVGDALELFATDLECGIRCSVSSSGGKGDPFLLPASRVAQIAAQLDSDTIRLDVTDTTIAILGNRARFTINTEPPSDFPDVPSPDWSGAAEIDAAELATAFRRTVFACDPVNVRYALGGVFIGSGVMAATDTKRMAIHHCARAQCGDAGVVPNKAVNAAIRMLSRCDGMASVRMTKNSLWMRCGAGMLYSRLQEGRFPNWSAVVPADGPVSAVATAGQIDSLCRQLGLILDEDGTQDSLLTFGNDSVRGVRVSAKHGECDASIPAKTSGEGDIRIQAKIFADWVRTLPDGAEVTMRLIDKESPLKATCGDSVMIVMPVKR